MNMQSPAASLAGVNRDLTTIRLQHPHRGFVEPRERNIRDASGKKRDPILAFALRRKHAAHVAIKERRFHMRGQRLDLAELAHQLQHAGGAHQLLQSGGLINIHPGAHQPQHSRAGKQTFEHQPSQEPRTQGTPHALLDICASRFDQAAVFDARWTRRFTTAAGQAQIHVLLV